jgi:hypothetical protein
MARYLDTIKYGASEYEDSVQGVAEISTAGTRTIETP